MVKPADAHRAVIERSTFLDGIAGSYLCRVRSGGGSGCSPRGPYVYVGGPVNFTSHDLRRSLMAFIIT